MDPGCRVDALFADHVNMGGHRLLPGGETEGSDRIDADIPHRPAAERQGIAHIGRVEQAIGESARDRVQIAQHAFGNQIAGAGPLRVVDGHIGFGNQMARGLARGDQAVEIFLRHGDRLFAEHRLPGLGRLDRPMHMKRIGQRHIDRVDIGIGQQVLIAVMDRHAGREIGKRRGLGRVSAGDSGKPAAPGFVDRRAMVVWAKFAAPRMPQLT